MDRVVYVSLLSEYIEFKNGKKRPAKQGVYPVYGGNGILSFAEQYNLDIGVVIGRVGAYCGSVFLSEGKCWVSDNAIGGKNRPNADLDYIYYLLKGLRLNTRQIGTSQPLLTQEILNNIQVQIPRLEIQKRIVNIIKPLDNKIKVNEQINHNLEQMAQAIFKSWFVNFEPFGGKMPTSWRVVNFSTFLTPRIEKTNDLNTPLFSVTDTGIYPRGKKFNKSLSKADTKNKIAHKTDLIFGMSREILNWGVMRSEIGAFSSAYNVFAVDNGINSKYLESFIKTHSRYFKDLIRPATREGQGVDKCALMLKSIYLPPDRILAEYYVIEDVLTEQMREKEEESARLAILRDALLPRLMSGELFVADQDDAKL